MQVQTATRQGRQGRFIDIFKRREVHAYIAHSTCMLKVGYTGSLCRIGGDHGSLLLLYYTGY